MKLSNDKTNKRKKENEWKKIIIKRNEGRKEQKNEKKETK